MNNSMTLTGIISVRCMCDRKKNTVNDRMNQIVDSKRGTLYWFWDGIKKN